MKILFLLLMIITLSLPHMTYAKSLYDVEMVNEYIGNTERNKDRIEKILEKLTNAADIKERIMIKWTDSRNYSTWGCAVTPDFFNNKEYRLLCNSSMANALTDDEIACGIAHELGHICSNGQKRISILLNLEDGEEFALLTRPHEERLADAIAVDIIAKAGYDVSKYMSSIKKVMMHEIMETRHIQNKNILSGYMSYPELLSSHPGYIPRITEYEDGVYKYIDNAFRYNDVLYDRCGMTLGAMSVNYNKDIYRQVWAYIKGKMSKEEYKHVLSYYYPKSEKELTESMILGMVNREYDKLFKYEKLANIKFFKYVDSLDNSSLQDVLKGLEMAQEDTDILAREKAWTIKDRLLLRAIPKRCYDIDEIYTERVKYVTNRLGLTDYKVRKIDFIEKVKRM